ncbi:MAG: hydrolase [Defluviitaleaceae bacterium]|nr:hydrolase [Defluviitaleaceae bacterium]
MKKYKCPCCGYYTHETDAKEGPIFEICEICYWQYDETAHNSPIISGANQLSLSTARQNYKKFGVCDEKFASTAKIPITA